MKLQRLLLLCITLAGLTCWLATVSYVLFSSHVRAEEDAQKLAVSLGKQLEGQLLLKKAGIGGINDFPDFEWWKQTGLRPDVCVAYTARDGGRSRRLCTGGWPYGDEWPLGFERLYRAVFQAGHSVRREVAIDGRVYGELTVTAGAGLELTQAWREMRSLMLLSGVTLSVVCLLVYWSISRALRPVKTIVFCLQTMEAGDLNLRVPDFELVEWRLIGSAINRFALSQQQLLAERQSLVLRLIALQEEERRYLARELHDEFGQCLAAVNAVASSIRFGAVERCPELAAEAEQISQITQRMLQTVRGLLGRLRPAEFDELGLASSLKGLIAAWNARGSRTRHRLTIVGDSGCLSESKAEALFRIAQECLTNIAKHAAASEVELCLTITESAVELDIRDNGIAGKLPFANAGGIGLLGMRERVSALRGRLDLRIGQPRGLIVNVVLPRIESTGACL
ncbi:MAG: histidine kinase [Methylomonas sp.]|nr:histidine kinase [Methylomonas sp.]